MTPSFKFSNKYELLTESIGAYQSKHVKQQVSVLPDYVEGLTAQVNKVVEFC